MAHGVKWDGANRRFGPPKGVTEEQCRTLHVFDNGPCKVSCWEFSPEELQEINRTGRVFQCVWSAGLPPTSIGSERAIHELVADFGPVWKLSEQPAPLKYSAKDKDDLLAMLILCGELGGMHPEEKPNEYLRRLIDHIIDCRIIDEN